MRVFGINSLHTLLFETQGGFTFAPPRFFWTVLLEQEQNIFDVIQKPCCRDRLPRRQAITLLLTRLSVISRIKCDLQGEFPYEVITALCGWET